MASRDDDAPRLSQLESDYLFAKQMLVERARTTLLGFTKYTKPDYQINWHHRLLCRKLDLFVRRKIKRLMVFMPPRNGKALAVDTPILTTTGWKRMADLQVGDMVFHPSGKPTRIVAKSGIWKDRQVWMVSSDDGADVLADGEHLWNVRLCRKRSVFKNRTTKELASRSSDRNPLIPTWNPLQLEAKALPIPPYTLGVWLGNGHSAQAIITSNEQDLSHQRGRIEAEGFQTSDQATALTFGILGLKALLREHGLLSNKHVPEIYLQGSIEQRMALLQGLIDTDGHVAPSGSIEFCNMNRQIAESVQALVRSLGVKTALTTGRAMLNGVDHGEKYRVTFYLKDAASVPRKAVLTRNAERTVGRYLTFKPAGLADTVCIQVESEDGLFLAGRGLLVTHNSELGSRRLPAFIFGQNPDARIIGTSYSADLASRMNRDIQRIIDTPSYAELFPETALFGKNVRSVATGSYLRNSDIFEIVNRQGVYRSAGVGGGVTGMGADYCFPAGTMVKTERGEIEISALVQMADRPKVLSYNHETGETEWKQILATRASRRSGLVKVQTAGGSSVICTGDHPIFVIEEGYRQAAALRRGQAVIRIKEESMPGMREGDSKLFDALSGLLQYCSEGLAPVRLRAMPEAFREAALRISEGLQIRLQRVLLLSSLRFHPSFDEEPKSLRSMREAGREEDSPILLERMSLSGIGGIVQRLPSMLEDISDKVRSKSVLLARLLVNGPCKADDRTRELTLQTWRELFQRVQRQTSDHSVQRSASMRDLRKVFRSSGSSYRPSAAEQFDRESDNALRDLSCCPSQVEEDSISSVTTHSRDQNEVFDIQVEGNSNFFANGVLVHNCIIDDPIKNAKDADSATFRRSLWEWYQSTLYTRLEKDGCILVILTRWHEDDLAGRLLALAESDPEADQWEILNLEAIKETDQPGDPRRIGDPLWPEKYPLERLLAMKASVGSRVWNALFQQRPTAPEGSIINRKWFRYYRELPSGIEKQIQSWDLTFKDSEGADYTVGQVWAKKGADRYLVDQVRFRGDFPTQIEAVRQMSAKHPAALEKIIEEKANGAALIATLCREISGMIPFNPKTSKEGRVMAISPEIEAGNVWLPDPSRAPWVQDLVEEFSAFPTGAHDDQVDAASQALLRLQTNRSGDFSDKHKQARKTAVQSGDRW